MLKHAVVACLLFSNVIAQDSLSLNSASIPSTGYLDFNGYYDTRNHSEFTLNILGNTTKRFHYFSLTNYTGVTESSDLAQFYSEQNLRFKLSNESAFDASLQWALREGQDNDDIKWGLRIRFNDLQFLSKLFKKLNMSYSVSTFIMELRQLNPVRYLTQLEHVYRIQVIPRLFGQRVYLSGFADQNMRYMEGKQIIRWVTEHQLGIMLLKQFYIVAEYRINELLSSKKQGMGYGFEYKMSF